MQVSLVQLVVALDFVFCDSYVINKVHVNKVITLGSKKLSGIANVMSFIRGSPSHARLFKNLSSIE